MSAKQRKNKPEPQPVKITATQQKVETGFAGFPQWAPAALLIFTALLYGHVWQNGFVKLDDDTYILDNPLIKNFTLQGILNVFTTFHSYNYHPLTTLTNLFEFSLFGMNPVPFHLFNIALHVINTWLVFKVIGRLCNIHVVAFIVAALFALTPMHVESVAWASERKDVLYTCFYLWAVLVYLRYISSSLSVRYYLAALILFLLSLLSKSAAVTLPVLLIAVDIYKGRKIDARMLVEKAPFFLLSLLFGVLAIKSQTSESGGTAVNNLSQLYSYTDRFFMLAYSVAFYFVKLILPMGLSAFHYFPAKVEGSLPWQYYASVPFLLLVSGLAYLAKPFRKDAQFAAAFFFITISVMMVVPVGNSLVNERYTYVPSIGLFYLLALIAVYYIKGNGKTVALVMFALYAVWLSYETWGRIAVWKDSTTILTDVIVQNPEFYHGYWVRGNVELQAGENQKALDDFNMALQYNPNFFGAMLTRGKLRVDMQDYNGAISDLQQVTKVDEQNGIALNALGMAYDGLDSLQPALYYYNRAIALMPGYALAYNNRSVILAKTGDINNAMADINRAISLDPKDVKMYINRGNIKSVQHDLTGAVDDFTYAIKLKPDDNMGYFNRGIARINLKDTAGACQDWQRAAKLGRADAAQLAQQVCH